MNKFVYRIATANDIPFLVNTIIEAEKSGTDKLTYTTIFGITEQETRKYIAKMLAEGIDGCELSITSFLLAEINGQTVAAIAAWIEGFAGTPSSVIKGNLLSNTLPRSVFKNVQKVSSILRNLHIEYVNNTIQIGLVYVSEGYRGQSLVSLLIDRQLLNLLQFNTKPSAAYVQVFGNNYAAIKAYEKAGFREILNKESSDKDTLRFMPSNTKILMGKKIEGTNGEQHG
jgi:ribosomal protein S18 acetylase RimI-like enzyme